jgi:hypothetical protein
MPHVNDGLAAAEMAVRIYGGTGSSIIAGGHETGRRVMAAHADSLTASCFVLRHLSIDRLPCIGPRCMSDSCIPGS